MARAMRYVAMIAFPLLFLTVSARPDLGAYMRHEAFLKRYPCGEPQPRVFELAEIIGEDVLREKIDGTTSIKPVVTVLHRCYSSGCCKNAGERCSPSATEDVKLTFLVAGHTLDFLEVEAVNHTQCACAPFNP